MYSYHIMQNSDFGPQTANANRKHYTANIIPITDNRTDNRKHYTANAPDFGPFRTTALQNLMNSIIPR